MTTDERQLPKVAVVPEPSGAGVTRDTPAAVAVGYHRTVLGVSAVILVACLLLRTSTGGHVRVPLVGISMPGLCLWRLSTGVECPGCGLTRCFIAMAHGNFAEAWHFHPAGTVLFAALLAQLPYRGLQLRRLARGRSELKHPALMLVLWLLVPVFLIQWLLRLSGLVQF